MEIERARRLLYIIYTCDESQVTMAELREINGFMDDLAPNIEVLWGLYRDNTLGEDVKVTLIATDFEKGDSNETIKHQEDKNRILKDALIESYYGNLHRNSKPTEVKEEKVEPESVETEVVEAETHTDESEAAAPEETLTETLAKPEKKKSFVDRFLEKLDRMMY